MSLGIHILGGIVIENKDTLYNRIVSELYDTFW